MKNKESILTDINRRNFVQYAYYRLGNFADAEDVVQDAYISLNQAIGKMDISNIEGYFYRIVSNLCSAALRNKRKYGVVDITQAKALLVDESVDFSQEYSYINKLLSTIPEEQSEVIRLRFHGEKSFVEIAKMLEIPVTTVKSRFIYGLEKIRKSMKH